MSPGMTVLIVLLAMIFTWAVTMRSVCLRLQQECDLLKRAIDNECDPAVRDAFSQRLYQAGRMLKIAKGEKH